MGKASYNLTKQYHAKTLEIYESLLANKHIVAKGHVKNRDNKAHSRLTLLISIVTKLAIHGDYSRPRTIGVMQFNTVNQHM